MTALPGPSVALDDQLCFALYAASRAVTARYRPMLDAIGLTYPNNAPGNFSNPYAGTTNPFPAPQPPPPSAAIPPQP